MLPRHKRQRGKAEGFGQGHPSWASLARVVEPARWSNSGARLGRAEDDLGADQGGPGGRRPGAVMVTGSKLTSGLIFSSAIGPTSVIQRTTRTHGAHSTELPAYCASWERNRPNGIHRRVRYTRLKHNAGHEPMCVDLRGRRPHSRRIRVPPYFR